MLCSVFVLLSLWPIAAQDLFLKPHPLREFAAANKSLGLGHDSWVFSIAMVENNNLCLDLAGDGNNGDLLQIWECNGHENQLWFFDDGAYSIQWAGDSSKCVDAGDMQAGTQLYVWDCNGSGQQYWGFDPSMWVIYLAGSGAADRDASLCMDLAGADEKLGNAVQVWDCNSFSEQQWWLKNGITFRLGLDEGLCFDLPGSDTSNGNHLRLWECNGQASQQWEFTDWQIKFAGDTSKCIDAGSLAAGNQLILWDCNGADQQIWGYDGSNGALYLSNSAADASFCVDLLGGAAADGTGLQTWDCNSCWNQAFLVIGPVSLGSAARASSSLGAVIGDCPPEPSPKPSPGSWDNLLPRCMDGDQHGWPVFNSQADLQGSPWGKYFQLVYGEVPDRGYPICTYGQIMLYKPHLDSAGVTPPNTFKNSCPGKTNAGQWYNTMSDDASWSNWIWNPDLSAPLPLGQGLPSNTWVEFHHQKCNTDGSATWLYYAPGSGIWAWLGNTQSYDDHKDAVSDISGKPCWGWGSGECGAQLEGLYTDMRNKGIDTVQFLKHSDMNCGNGAIEIVDVAGPGNNPCGQSGSGATRFKAGWGAVADCNCDNGAKDHTVNCDGFGIRSR